jgi:hypothetical protein
MGTKWELISIPRRKCTHGWFLSLNPKNLKVTRNLASLNEAINLELG